MIKAMTSPGSVITSGRYICLRSIKKHGTAKIVKIIRLTVTRENPVVKKIATKIRPVSSSTKGYMIDIEVLQLAHLPLKNNQETIGMF